MAGTEWANRELLRYFQLTLKHQNPTFNLATALVHTYIFILMYEDWRKEMIGCCHIPSLAVVEKNQEDLRIQGDLQECNVMWFNHGNEKHQTQTTLPKLWPLNYGREMNWCLWLNKKTSNQYTLSILKASESPSLFIF